MIHFCHFLRLGGLYWILVFSSHLVRPRHNFWYPYWLYLWEKNISWTKGGPFDFSRHQNARATAQTAWNELKFFLGGPRTLNNGKNFRAHFFSTNVEKWLALLTTHQTPEKTSPHPSPLSSQRLQQGVDRPATWGQNLVLPAADWLKPLATSCWVKLKCKKRPPWWHRVL